MTANFQVALDHLLKVEGGYVDDAADPGGATNYGISLRYLADAAHKDHAIFALADYDKNGDIDSADIRHLTPAVAGTLYKYAFWSPQGYDYFSDKVATKLLDMAVNMGPKAGNMVFQRAINALKVTGTRNLAMADGSIGPATQSRYNFALKEFGEDGVLQAIRLEQIAKYDALIAANPKLAKFRAGWINRVNSC